MSDQGVRDRGLKEDCGLIGAVFLWAAFIAFVILMALVVGAEAQTCTPGTQDGNGIWTGNRIPVALLPPGFVNVCVGTPSYLSLVAGPIYQGCLSGTDHWADVYFWKYGAVGASGCGGNQPAWRYQYDCVSDTTDLDYDCDGLLDSVDPDPSTPSDPCDSHGGNSDTDQYCNDVDPFPADSNCPGQGSRWQRSSWWINKNVDCVRAWYRDTGTPSCGAAYYDTGMGCASATWNQGDYAYMGDVDKPILSWDNIIPVAPGPTPGPGPTVPGTPGGPSIPAPGPDPVPGEFGGMLEELIKIDANTKGSKTVLTDLFERMGIGNTSLDGILTGIGVGNTTLGQIKTAIEGLPNAWGTGIETRIDATNVKLGEIKDKIITMGEGDLPGVPAGDLAQIQDQSQVADAENTGRLQAAQTAMTGWLDTWWASNPIRSMVDNTHINTSGSSSFSFTTSFGSASYDLGGLAGGLDTIGLMLVGLAGIGGVLVVLRN